MCLSSVPYKVGWWFSKSCVHENYLQTLLKTVFLAVSPGIQTQYVCSGPEDADFEMSIPSDWVVCDPQMPFETHWHSC